MPLARPSGALAMAVWLGLCLGACSKNDLPTDEFKILENTPQERAAAMAHAKASCVEVTRERGRSSVASIFSRMKPGDAEQDYRECMEDKGFDPDSTDPMAVPVSSESAPPPVTQPEMPKMQLPPEMEVLPENR